MDTPGHESEVCPNRSGMIDPFGAVAGVGSSAMLVSDVS
jgi:hypothetical protein